MGTNLGVQRESPLLGRVVLGPRGSFGVRVR